MIVRKFIWNEATTTCMCQKIEKTEPQCFGHVSRTKGDNLEKIVVQGNVGGSC